MLFDEIESFVRVVEAGSFTAAAKQLGVPKSTLSRALSRLEDATRVRLLRRSTRSIALTEAGERFFEQVGTHVGGLRDAMVILSEEDDVPRGLLRVTMPVDVGECLLSDIVSRFVQRHPGVHVDVDVSGRLVNLVEEGFDVAIRAATKLKDSSLVARKLFNTEIMLFASPAYLAQRGTPKAFQDLGKHDVIVFSPPGSRSDVLGLREVAPKSRFTVTDYCFLRGVLASGGGIGPLPSFAAKRYLDDGRIVRVVPEWSKTGGGLHVVYPSAKHVPKKVHAFRDAVVEAVNKLGLPGVTAASTRGQRPSAAGAASSR